MKYRMIRRIGGRLLSAFLLICIFINTGMDLYAAPETETDYAAQAEERKLLPVQSNQTENWPEGPEIGAQSAILLEANTGVILYAKNIYEKTYPASTTKLMTCLLAAENSQKNETVTFSHDAVFSIERGSSNIGIDAGEAMTMEECLYGILSASANEVANAVAEHVAGTMDAFAEMMNERASQLGCKNSHFVNAHGLHDENHYTCAYDLAIIAKAFFQNELLSKIGNTPYHRFEPTDTQPDDFIVRNKHRLISGEIPYEGIKGGKTGFTSQARQTLVTCAEQNGMKLICVIMKEESPEQFYDTVKLFDYGFTNFAAVKIAEYETNYSIQNSNFFNTSSDVFGNSQPILALNPDSYLIMPKVALFKELDSTISYDTENENEVAVIDYFYHNVYLGTATVNLAKELPASYDFAQIGKTVRTPETAEPYVIVVNVKTALLAVSAAAIILIAAFVIHSVMCSYSFLSGKSGETLSKRRRRLRKRSRKEEPNFSSSRYDSYNP